MLKEVYLDSSATTIPFDEVIETISITQKTVYGNPSSTHSKGTEAKKEINIVRDLISSSLKVDNGLICFTSGGTESNNIAIKGLSEAYSQNGKHLITTMIEHPSVLNTFRYLQQLGFEVDFLKVDNMGIINLDELSTLIRDDTILISVMYVNNEVGSIQPIYEISKIIKSINSNILLHVDAVQAYGKIPLNPNKMGIDSLSISGHKIHGPKGVGALYVKKGICINPVIFGGGQEYSIRSGTENVPAICGLGKAVDILFDNIEEKWSRMEFLKEYLRKKLLELFPDSLINTPNHSAPHILNVSFSGVKADEISNALSLCGIFVSTKSACSCYNKTYSHVLSAMGMEDVRIESAVRFSLSILNTIEDVDYVINTLTKILT